jgi:RNA methyltransferase, TrmH family
VSDRAPVRVVRSRDNPLVVRLRKQRRDPGGYRRGGGLWLEGEHLCEAWRARHGPPACVVVRESAARRADVQRLAEGAQEQVELADAVFADISGLESPGDIGYWVEAPPTPSIDPTAATLVLDRLQDAGNAGTLLRTAAALGFHQVLAMGGTVALWSPKVLRAGQGAHFALAIVESAVEGDLEQLAVPLIAAVPRAPALLWEAALPWPCAWVLGHEGQGVATGLVARCSVQVAIPQPGGEESLNVASAGAICLYESVRQRSGRQPPGGQ